MLVGAVIPAMDQYKHGIRVMSVLLFSGYENKPGRLYFQVPARISSDSGKIFEIGERITAGGNGVVHECTDAVTGEQLAIKFQLDLRKNRLRRFAREQELLQGLSHAHLMLYAAHGSVVGVKVAKRNVGKPERKSVTIPFLVMQLARCNLFETIKESEVSKEVYFGQFRGLANALGVLHQKAIHRDIKPENILVIGDRWVLSDYGLCDLQNCLPQDRFTPDWEVIGPRFWMSPEANNRSIGQGAEINAASDVFQLASVFWFVVNRNHPTGVVTKLDWRGPEALFDPIYKALHFDSAMRPSNGVEFARMIDGAIVQ